MIAKFFEKYKIINSDKLIIACSGGADSMFLLHEILKLHPKKSVAVAHFNHNLRGGESDDDFLFIEKYSKENGLDFILGEGDITGFAAEKKIGIEEAARIKRYEFLEKIREEKGAKFILTAHHLDDSIETFLFNLIRGTKLGGLTGIDELNGNILRPLLHITKNNILNSCLDENIPYRNDSTNADDKILRNHIRLNILPEFEKINPSYKSNIDDLMEYFREMQKNIEIESQKIIKSDNSFGIDDFNELGSFRQKEFIAYVFKLTNSGTIGLTKGNIDEVIRFIGDKGNHTKKEIKNMKLYKKNGKIFF